MSSDLYRDCRGNSICMVEALKYAIDSGYEPGPDELYSVSGLLGLATKKTSAFLGRYMDVFTRLVQRNCVVVGDGELCIYSWSPRAYIRYFPVSIDATGTILYISRDGHVSTIAYPIHRAHDIEGRGVRLYSPSEKGVVEITRRVDGYPITFYYNPFLERWVCATRYVLHNMAYYGRQLVVEDINEFINPYARVADYIASENGLYEKLDKYRGYTFTFILESPEPAITRPNIELFSPSDFKLYLLVARDPSGRLLTVRESSKLVDWETVCVLDYSVDTMEDLERIIEEARNDLYHRSLFIRYGDNEHRPYTIEVKSRLYPEAMAVKYQSSPKSLLILASHGYGDVAVELLTSYGDIRSVGREIVELYNRIEELLVEKINNDVVEEMLNEIGLYKQLKGELLRARKTGSVKRFVRKLVALACGETVYEARDALRKIHDILSSG